MEKIILVDGNNLLFRSYYATAYNGNLMRSSKGFPTNAIYGFVNMMNKIIEEEKPTYIMVAFDKGKTFRHEQFDFYKDGRKETPDELKQQFPIAKKILNAMGIKYYEIDNYEADDIIGTFAKFCDLDKNFIGTIISSDRDLLQLISDDIDIKLLKQKSYIRYNKKTFYEEYKINPINIIDLKALMGDASDNIPGVKGIGEKTALKLLQDYQTLDGIYENIEKISGKLKEKLINGKKDAYMSYYIATICKDVPMNINISDTKYIGPNEELNDIYEELEFYSLLKSKTSETLLNYQIIDDISNIKINDDVAIYLELDGSNYHTAKIIGMGLYNNDLALYIPYEKLENIDFLNNKKVYTYDLKKNYVALKYQKFNLRNMVFDTMIASSLLEYQVKEDIAYLANKVGYSIPFETKKIEDIVLKAKFIYETRDKFIKEIKENEIEELFNEIEMPLAYVLGDMEYNGVNVSKEVLLNMKEEINLKMSLIAKDIYNMAGTEFNISSPAQLGEILYEKLKLPHGKKTKSGYSTAADVLAKLVGKHPIIKLIMEYRVLNKLYTNYIISLMDAISDDGKIHTIYTQTLTRTGRLSSIEPNLQNIPIRTEYGRLIRKAFKPSNNSIIVSGDYSQIELRILAHMANVSSLIEAFNNDIDIHTKTASDIFNVDVEYVTKEMRRVAKAVNFGIIYGISDYGLSENLNIPIKSAKEFIDKYLQMYPGIKEYMDEKIKEAHINGYTKTLFNRKRSIEELKSNNYLIRTGGERMALNTPIQGTSADIIKKAMVLIDKEIKQNNLQSKLIIQVHDELVFDCLESEKEKIILIMTNVMENVCKLNVPLKIEVSYGNDWYEAK